MRSHYIEVKAAAMEDSLLGRVRKARLLLLHKVKEEVQQIIVLQQSWINPHQ
jgi:hypothetical protein